MAAGMQVTNDAGTFQIDGVFKSFVLVRTVVVVTTTGSNVGVQTSRGSTPMNPGEIVAIRSYAPCAMISVGPGALVVSAIGGVGTEITCYFFAPITTSSATYGLQIFNETTGDLVFCAAKKPLRFVGFPAGSGSFTYDGNRTYAAIAMNQFYEVDSDTAAVGGGRYFQRLSMARSRITSISGGIKISQEFEYAYSGTVSSPVGPPPPLPPPQASASIGLHAIIDVTNY